MTGSLISLQGSRRLGHSISFEALVSGLGIIPRVIINWRGKKCFSPGNSGWCHNISVKWKVNGLKLWRQTIRLWDNFSLHVWKYRCVMNEWVPVSDSPGTHWIHFIQLILLALNKTMMELFSGYSIYYACVVTPIVCFNPCLFKNVFDCLTIPE